MISVANPARPGPAELLALQEADPGELEGPPLGAGDGDTGHYRVPHDRIDRAGVITLRHHSRLHHIGLGRRHAGTRVLVLARDLHIRVLTTDGELLRELRLDPSRDYPPQDRP